MPRLDCTSPQTIAWGSHLCTFYRSPADLRRLVSAYLQAGLEDGEACLWVLPSGTTVQDAIDFLRPIFTDLARYMYTRQLELIPCDEGCYPTSIFGTESTLAWSNRVLQATAFFGGLRVAGDTSWLQSKYKWDQFIAYERQVRTAAQQTRIIALCTYPAAAWNPDEMLSVMRCHGSVLLPHQHGWKTVKSDATWEGVHPMQFTRPILRYCLSDCSPPGST
jgi:hypothetical protein